jgi:hypothetical protein
MTYSIFKGQSRGFEPWLKLSSHLFGQGGAFWTPKIDPFSKISQKIFFRHKKAACFGGEADGNVSLSYSIFSLIFSTL